MPRDLTILGSCYCEKQIGVSFYASVLLLNINFVIIKKAQNFGHLVVQLHSFEIQRKSRIDFWLQ